jgi:hypothetical protein
MKILGGRVYLRRASLPGLALVFLMCFWVAFPTSVNAQSTAAINGTVRDSSGSIIPAADVVLTNTQTNVERRTVTNDVGIYVFLNIIPGEYRLQASKASFKTSKQSAFTLAVNQTATYDFTLDVGEITQEVTIEAVGAELQASTAELGAVVGQQQVTDLPLNGRNFTQLLSLTPGVSPVSVSQNNGGWGAITEGSTFSFPSINGQNNRSNFFMLDGTNNQGAFLSTYAVPPIIDTIHEFKVQSHNDDAEFGGALGGIVNVQSRSGSNSFHGSAWEFLRNDAFDARNTFFADKTVFRQNTFGGAVGGPIFKNKTFFYGGYEGFRFRRPANTFFRVPTEANLRGDLSDIPTQIYNPFSTQEDPNNPGTFIRDPFPGNIIPPNLLDPSMVRFAQETLPLPNVSGNATFNALDSTPFSQVQDNYTFRIDHTLTERDSIWFRWSALRRDNSGSGGRPALEATHENPTKNYAISYVHTFNPSTVIQAQYGRVKGEDNGIQSFRGLDPSFAGELGFADTFYSQFTGGVSIIPGLNVANFFSGGQSNTLDPKWTNIHQWKASGSKISGNHTFKFGGEFDSNTFEAIYANAAVEFTSAQTNDPKNPGSTGSSLASYLLGVPASASRRNVHETTRLGGLLSFYFHDQWKITPKLTMNVGLRFDRTINPPYGANGSEGENGGIETGAYDLNRGVYIVQKLPPLCSERGRAPCLPSATLPEHVEVSPTGKIYRDINNWGPRFGLAYRLAANTVLRGSFGVFYDNWAAVTQTAQNYEGSWPDVAQQLINNMNTPSPSQPLPNRTALNPFPTGGEGLFPAPTPFESVLWYMDPNFKNPYSMQWNLGLQHQLNSSTVVSANYVGSGTRRLNIGGYYNVATTPGPGEQAPRRPFPYIAPTFFDRSWGRANYHSFQFTLDKKYSNGLAYLVSYTYGKSIDIGCSGWYGVEGCSIQDPYNFNNDRSVAGFDVTHLLSFAWVYQLPFGPGKRFNPENKVVSHIIGNWQVNGITSFISGLPYDLGVDGDIANTGNFGTAVGFGPYMRLNLVGDPELSNPTPQSWFNKSAFAVPAPFTFGNSGRNILRGDGTNNIDLSIFRQFPIKEQWKVEFRAEMFNAFNTPTYNLPDRNFSSPNFGVVTSTQNAARQIQFALKILF